MNQHIQRFESSMFEYCSNQAERAFKLLEDGDTDNGMSYFAHLADVLQLLVQSRNSQGLVSINEFTQSILDLDDLDKDQVFTHLQENGYGQYIPE
jgi:hypothetical protein